MFSESKQNDMGRTPNNNFVLKEVSFGKIRNTNNCVKSLKLMNSEITLNPKILMTIFLVFAHIK